MFALTIREAPLTVRAQFDVRHCGYNEDMAKYHHGDLRRQLLEVASEIEAEYGTEAVTLRELARTANVSHSAPVHHFKTRKNLLTELATQGFNLLNATLKPHQGNIYDMGVAYVFWAVEHPGFYTVMW